MTYGVAFQLINEAALDYLNNREIALGGYISHITLFQPKDPNKIPMPVLLYVATSSNPQWLGYATEEDIADQVYYYFLITKIPWKHTNSWICVISRNLLQFNCDSDFEYDYLYYIRSFNPAETRVTM